MLAGFLEGLKVANTKLRCCIPHPIESIAKRFPTILWESYTEENRSKSIKQCDLWLGVGGTPFQSNVSDWFIKHLESEYNFCHLYRKPMAFIGIGCQDVQSFRYPILKRVIESADAIWTRDTLTHELITKHTQLANCYPASDLAHIFLREHSLKAIKPGRLSVALNFDYQNWPSLTQTITSLSRLNPSEQLWLIQEKRPLPGSEQWLYTHSNADIQNNWQLVSLDHPEKPLTEVIDNWPSSEWLLTSRFHTCLVSAWAGTKTVVLNTNSKLLSAAVEFGYQALPPNVCSESILDALISAKAPIHSAMHAKADLAQYAMDELIAHFKLKD